MMNKKIVFVFFLFCISLASYSQENKTNVIRLNLDNNKNKRLALRIRCSDKPNLDYNMYFNGIRDGNIWTFSYSDTLYDKNSFFMIEEPTGINTLSRYLSFEYICNDDTLKAVNLSFSNIDTLTIDAVYLRTDTASNIPAIDKNGNPILKTIIDDLYLLKSCEDKELIISMEVQTNKFYRFDVDSSHYTTEMNKYIDLVKKYPDSHSLIVMLESRLNIFKSKKDVQIIFDCFSQENKNSYYGKRISQYLADNYFKNSILKVWNADKDEAIVTDSTKFNLIIFSASWCSPCIEEIPILKKMYKDLSDKLDMTYVSIDEAKTINNWRQLMKKENILWRSVLAESDIENIREKYHVFGVPYCLFVHPDGFMEPMDVRNTNELNYLYETVEGGSFKNK